MRRFRIATALLLLRAQMRKEAAKTGRPGVHRASAQGRLEPLNSLLEPLFEEMSAKPISRWDVKTSGLKDSGEWPVRGANSASRWPTEDVERQPLGPCTKLSSGVSRALVSERPGQRVKFLVNRGTQHPRSVRTRRICSASMRALRASVSDASGASAVERHSIRGQTPDAYRHSGQGIRQGIAWIRFDRLLQASGRPQRF